MNPGESEGVAANARAAEVTAAIQELHHKLQIAAAYNPAQPDHGRDCARIALIGVLEFLAVLFPDMPTLPLALQDLLQGLKDLDSGTVIPLLQPVDVRGRRRQPMANELFKALPAAAMTILMKNRKMSRDSAAREIAARLSRLGYRHGRVRPGQIAKWREKMMTESRRENLAVQRYKQALEVVKGKKPSDAVRLLLDNLLALHPAEFLKKGGL